MGNIKLAFTNIIKNIRNEKELKVSFIITVIGMAINNTAFLVIWYCFGKEIGEINGWSAIDIFGLYGFNTVAYGVINTIFAGIYYIPTYITTANLDKFLLTPKNLLLKISTSKFKTSAVGDLLFGLICFVIYAYIRKMSLLFILLSLYLMVIVSIVYYGFSLICATVSFYVMDGKNITNGLYETFLSTSLYHGGAFTGILKAFFTFVIPSLLIGAFPLELVKDFSLSKLLLITGLTIFWLVISIIFFNLSLKKYNSNNLFGFGS